MSDQKIVTATKATVTITPTPDGAFIMCYTVHLRSLRVTLEMANSILYISPKWKLRPEEVRSLNKTHLKRN